ncbi:MAG: OmpA family protein [Verrucomicrobia bacterium]|nr:OmpA family protein [Verrucomicrobiota bacterium]
MTFHLFRSARPAASIFCCLALMSALAACNKNSRGNSGAANTRGGDYDTVNGTPLPERREGVSFLGPGVNRSQFAAVRFPFDSFTLGAEERGKVKAVADFLRNAPNSVIVAGFCDERGTAEYNRALGEKRAGTVREALLADGVAPDRVQTVSFGAEMPADPGHNESAWAANRRAEFGITR